MLNHQSVNIQIGCLIYIIKTLILLFIELDKLCNNEVVDVRHDNY